MDQTPEEQWRELSELILTEMSEWRRNHPKATRARNRGRSACADEPT
jgi:hypothetical protein